MFDTLAILLSARLATLEPQKMPLSSLPQRLRLLGAAKRVEATTRSVAGCRTDSTRERTQAGTAASRSS